MIKLVEAQIENLLAAARAGQAHRLEMIELVQKFLSEYPDALDEEDDEGPDMSDFRHMQAEHARTARIIDDIERKVIFTLDRD